ncbi:MAG TPA: hypothetical protein DCL43_10965 [Chitinophagaceae bacterium]|nr:hypothetical protein [Chitinophagaceae bacterium]HAN39854.1 hypothetical protein [Chitinophagaceae bacterium]
MEYKLLIVDDSILDRMLMRQQVDTTKFEVFEFEDGAQALDWLEHQSRATKAVVLLDLNMPVMDGFTVVEKWRHSKLLHPHVKAEIIIVSAALHDRVVERGIESDIVAFVGKPLTEANFNHVLEHALQNLNK